LTIWQTQALTWH